MRPALRLVSANLANGAADPAAFLALVERLDPDVVAVQELAPDQAEALARALPFGKLDPGLDHHGMGIALRDPGSVRRIPLPYRSAFVAELPPGGDGSDPVEVVNVHLAAPHVRPFLARWRERRGQVRRLLAYLDGVPHPRRVVLGDLNATPLWPAYRHLRTRLDDAAGAAARQAGHRPLRTWGPFPGSPRLLRIDHVLVRGLQATAVRVLPLPGSDHSALVVDLPRPPASDP